MLLNFSSICAYGQHTGNMPVIALHLCI